MIYSTYFSLLSVASIVSAAPKPPVPTSPRVLFYVDTYYKGDGWLDPLARYDNCFDVNYRYNDKTSSIKVMSTSSAVRTYCKFYVDGGCKGASYQLGEPGDADLTGGGFNDKISSAYCWGVDK